MEHYKLEFITFEITMLTAGRIRDSPMLWAFPARAIKLQISYEANKPLSKFKECISNMVETVFLEK